MKILMLVSILFNDISSLSFKSALNIIYFSVLKANVDSLPVWILWTGLFCMMQSLKGRESCPATGGATGSSSSLSRRTCLAAATRVLVQVRR